MKRLNLFGLVLLGAFFGTSIVAQEGEELMAGEQSTEKTELSVKENKDHLEMSSLSDSAVFEESQS